MTNIVETQNSVTEAFNERLVQVETVAKKLAENQNQLPQMENEDPPRELLRNNRFAPLVENYRSVTEDKDKNHKLLIMGNSHVKNIQVNKYLPNCIVNKYVMFSCSEVVDRLDTLDNDYEVIFLHDMSNDIRDNTSEECVRLHVDLIEKLTSHYTFTKVISLPFFTVKDYVFNEKVSEVFSCFGCYGIIIYGNCA